MQGPENTSAKLKIAEKIPFFKGLSVNQVQQILHAGNMASHEGGKTLCREGENSNAMFILLAGELAIRNADTHLATVKPVQIVGEMGLITNQPRSATIETLSETMILEIGKMHLDMLLRKDIEMAVKLYRNMLVALCKKIRDNNAKLVGSAIESGREIAANVV